MHTIIEGLLEEKFGDVNQGWVVTSNGGRVWINKFSKYDGGYEFCAGRLNKFISYEVMAPHAPHSVVETRIFYGFQGNPFDDRAWANFKAAMFVYHEVVVHDHHMPGPDHVCIVAAKQKAKA